MPKIELFLFNHPYSGPFPLQQLWQAVKLCAVKSQQMQKAIPSI
jgi:hypothetical protein